MNHKTDTPAMTVGQVGAINDSQGHDSFSVQCLNFKDVNK